MSRYTVANLREFVEEANGKYPLDEPTADGSFKRFGINQAYGGYRIVEYIPNTSGIREITKRGSARECALEFTEYLLENF